MYNLEAEPPKQQTTIGFVTAEGEDLHYHMAPYVAFGHFLNEAIDITHDPEAFLDCTLTDSDDDGPDEDGPDEDDPNDWGEVYDDDGHLHQRYDADGNFLDPYEEQQEGLW